MAPKRRTDARLRTLARRLDGEWLTAQRWYRSKSLTVSSVEVADAAPLPPEGAWLLMLDATDSAGRGSRYLVPAMVDAGALREPRDGEGVWRTIVELIASGETIDAAGSRWQFEPSAALETVLPQPAATAATLSERRLAGEQSNTSVVLGDRLILKVYRLQEEGPHPEVQVNAFLTEVGCEHVPRQCGSVTYLPAGGEPSAAAILQELVPTEGDAWSWALGVLGEAGGAEAMLEAAAQIGSVTAELHGSLASRPATPGFPARAATRDELAAWRASAEGQLDGALAVLGADDRGSLERMAPRLRATLASIDSASGARVSRIHGDYHLGQLLRTGDAFKVIDFEGEPARPLAERKAPSSPLRDVAGMLRSLDYLAEVARRERGVSDLPEKWTAEARTAFLRGYGGLSGAEAALCRAFEIEKACYEVRYEADNRPTWLWLPLAALERLAAPPRRRPSPEPPSPREPPARQAGHGPRRRSPRR